MRSTSENADIFTTRDVIYLVFAEKGNFSFNFILNGNTESTTELEIQKAQLNFFLGRFLFDLSFAVCLLGITSGVNLVCT